MKDMVFLGPVPAQEPCEQVGPDCHYGRMHMQCRAFKEQVMRHHPVPEDLRGLCGYKVHGSRHELGPYLELVAWFDNTSQSATDWAYTAEQRACHEDFGNVWDDESRQILGLPARGAEEVAA